MLLGDRQVGRVGLAVDGPPLEANTTLRVPAWRAPSSTWMLPTTLTSASKAGRAIEVRASGWAARWKITSGRAGR